MDRLVYEWIILGGCQYPANKVYRCVICGDTGELLDDDDIRIDLCDCVAGEALRAGRWFE